MRSIRVGTQQGGGAPCSKEKAKRLSHNRSHAVRQPFLGFAFHLYVNDVNVALPRRVRGFAQGSKRNSAAGRGTRGRNPHFGVQGWTLLLPFNHSRTGRSA